MFYTPYFKRIYSSYKSDSKKENISEALQHKHAFFKEKNIFLKKELWQMNAKTRMDLKFLCFK